jgi:hypothetical protein
MGWSATNKMPALMRTRASKLLMRHCEMAVGMVTGSAVMQLPVLRRTIDANVQHRR